MTFQKMKTICIVLSLMFSFLVHAEVPAFDNDKPATTFTSDYSQTYNKIWDASYLPGAIDPATIVNYDISMDFEINNQVAGPLIALTDASNFFMWQIYVPGDGNSWFRPHSWINGAFALMGEVNITSTAPVAMHSVYTLKIEIRGDKASTYINNVLIDLNRVNPRGAGVNYGYANLGFRHLSTAEDAYYDNIKTTTIISGNPVTLYDENFSTSNMSFTYGNITGGRLHEVNNPGLALATSWDGIKFNTQWDAVDALNPNDVNNGYALFYWPNRRIIRSKSTYSTPYTFTSDIDLSDANNRGGVIIRASAAGGVDLLQEPTTGTGFNREGIAFYPSSDGASMIVQFTGTENGASTTFTQILVPKPVGVSTLLTRATIKIEDFGSIVYVYYNNVRFIRINLGGLSGGIYTSGTVYNSDMTSMGTFTGMEIESVGKVAIAQRGATLKLYSVTLGTISVPDPPTGVTATVGNAQASVAFTTPASNGGSAITSYTVTSSPGGLTATGASSPLTVTGLTNGTTYTFTATATNVAGTGLGGSSDAVMPMASTGIAAFDNDKPATTFTSAYSQNYNKIYDASNLPNRINPASVVNYDISMDFEVNTQVAGPMFAVNDANNFFYWQIYLPGDGSSWFRPHSWINGGVAVLAEVNLGSIAPVVKNVVYTLKIEVRGDKASTYINNVLIDANRVNPRGAGINYGYANLGFRQLSTAEDAYFDNIKTTTNISGSPVTLYEENFSSSNLSYSYGSITGGRLHEVNNPDLALATSWDGTKFYNQWDASGVNAFTAPDIVSGSLQFGWSTKIIIRSKQQYTSPYIYTAEVDYTTSNNKGGIVIRANGTGDINDLQEPPVADGSTVFNREGIVFYPSADGANMIVQFTGVLNGYSTPVTKILVPKPVGVSTLLTKATLKIEDFGSTVYVYYNNARFIRINLGGLSGGVYTTGTVYDSGMTSMGTFTGMEVEAVGKVAVAQRDATLKLNSVTIGTTSVPGAPTSVVATAGNTKASVAFTAPASNGGSAILDYTVTSSPDGLTATAASSPITVTGLTNGTAYTFTATARNAAGASAGGASSAVTPHATNNNIAVSSATNISALTLTPVSDLVVTANTLTVNAPKIVNSITVAPGAGLQLTSGQTLTAGTVTLQSDATGTATLVDNTTNSPQAVTATVQQYVTSGRNWYMSIPLASGASTLLNRGTSVVCFDEPSGTWIAPAAGTLNKMQGYIQVATSTPSVTGTTGIVDFTGEVNTGAHTINLTRSVGMSGFNLVGNPYPSYLDWNTVTKTNVSNTMWYRTKEGSVYKFYTYIANEGAGVGSPATVTNKIPPMQAFWVRVDAEGTGSIAVNNTMRSHKDVAGNIMKAPKQVTRQLLRLEVSNGTNTDETVVYFNANASDTFDQYDAQKRSNNEPSIPEIFTQVGSEQLVINGMNSVKYDTEIPLGFSTLTAANNLSISANEMTNFETGTRVFLIDKLNPSVETELTNGAAYSFSAPITTATTGRFSLLFRAPGNTTGVDNTAKLNAQVFVNANNQITIIAPEKASYSIYNALGQLIKNGILNTKGETINTKLNVGVYVVKVANVSKRIIIK